MSKRYYFILTFFLQAIILSAQTYSVKGIIKDENTEPLRNAVVQLFLGEKYIGFKKTNKDGIFQFSDLEKGEYKVEINAMNFEKSQQTISLYKNVEIELVLFENKINLQEVIIKDKSFGKVKEDTIQYNLSTVRTGAERTLGDLIEKLPGLELDEKGMVFYQGKKIDNILIDGSEFFGNKHQLATKNISEEMIEGIDLITNYQPNEILKSFGKGGKRVLNIKLKENYQNTLSGNLSFATGTDYDTNNRVNLFNFNKKGNVAFVNHYNTIGENSMTMDDYFELNNKIRRNTNGISKIDDKDIPSFLKEERNFNKKENAFSSFNFNKKLNNKLLIKNYLLFDYNSTIKKEETYKDYVIFDLNEVQEIKERPYFLQNTLSFDYKINNKNYIISESVFGYSQNEINSDINKNIYTENIKEQNFTQQLSLFNVLSSSFLGEFRFDFSKQNKDYSIVDEKQYNQNKFDFKNYNIGYFLKSSKKDFSYDFYVENSVQNTILSTFFDENKKQQNRLNIVEIGSIINYKHTDRFSISASLDIKNYSSNHTSLEQNYSFSPTTIFIYSMKKGGRFTFNYSYLEGELPTLDFVNSYKRRLDYLTVIDKSLIEKLFIKRSNKFSFNYAKIDLKKGRTFFLNVNYSNDYNDIGENITLKNGLLYKEFFKADKSKNLLFFVNYSHVFNKIPIALKTSMIINYTEGIQEINNQINSLYTTRFNVKTDFTSRLKSKIQFYYKNTFQVFVNDNSKIDQQRIYQLKNDFGITFNYTKSNIKLGLLNNNQFIRSEKKQQNSDWNFYTEIDYKFKYFDVFVQGFDFMKLERNTVIRDISNINYQGYTSLQTLSGYLIGGIRFYI